MVLVMDVNTGDIFYDFFLGNIKVFFFGSLIGYMLEKRRGGYSVLLEVFFWIFLGIGVTYGNVEDIVFSLGFFKFKSYKVKE